MPKGSHKKEEGTITREGLLASPWPGFTVPRYTQVPDEVFDVLMPILTEAEFKCLCYICRRTFGFRKDADAISLSQMSAGIKTKDGKVIDGGTGLTKRSVQTALSFLTKASIVHVQKRVSAEGEYETNVYSLHVLPSGQVRSPSITPPHPPRPSSAASAPMVGQNLPYPGEKSTPGVGHNLPHPRAKLRLGVGQNSATQETDDIHTVNNNHIVAPEAHKSKNTIRATLIDLGVSKSAASRLISQFGIDATSRVIEYALYRLSRGWQPSESLPGWLVSAITQGWEIPSWFKTTEEVAADQKAQTRAQQENIQRLEEERRREEEQMTKQRSRVLRALGISKGTDLLWKKVNQWLQERGAWRPALTTAVLRSVSEERAVVVCGYPFSLEMVRQCSDAIREALAALTGRVVEVEVEVEDKLFAPEE